jgi:hypothetical protein
LAKLEDQALACRSAWQGLCRDSLHAQVCELAVIVGSDCHWAAAERYSISKAVGCLWTALCMVQKWQVVAVNTRQEHHRSLRETAAGLPASSNLDLRVSPWSQERNQHL